MLVTGIAGASPGRQRFRRARDGRPNETGLFVQRFLIMGLNVVLLILILIGIPAITGAQWGSLQVSSAPKAHTLRLWGL